MTELLDNTISDILQDNPAVEYVEPRENPIATIPNEGTSGRKSADTSLFNFSAEHNGIQCIESRDPKDRGTDRQFWFTVAMMCAIFGVAERTLRFNIQCLIDDGELVSAISCRDAKILDLSGVPHKTTIYNLEE